MNIILDETTESVLIDNGDDDDELDHFFCCDENRALCGTDVSDVPITDLDPDGNPDLCVVCRDLEFQPCERCGE